MKDLVHKMLSGDPVALSRLMSFIENNTQERLSVMTAVQEHCGALHCIGVTGPPGSGKSTLVNHLIAQWRQRGKKVGVVAIDPSSPFSGGAVLGDRIRMQEHAGDDGVFIRSLGSRGSRGGLSRFTCEIVKLYDAYGMDICIVETVGVGQTELDIMGIADTTLVVLTPESGDTIQTMKAGILEIADIFVVNKSDRPGATQMQKGLQQMIKMGPEDSQKNSWCVPVILTNALKGEGIEEVRKDVERHLEMTRKSPLKKSEQSKTTKNEFREIVLSILGERVDEWTSSHTDKFSKTEEINPYRLAQDFLKEKKWDKQ